MNMVTTVADWERAIRRRLVTLRDKTNPELSTYDGLISRHGQDVVEMSISETVASMNWPKDQGISGSDINHTIDGLVRSLGEPSIFADI
jgi:hypothetical protein